MIVDGMVFCRDWKMPNLLEKEYYKHIIGKAELKSKLGRLRGGEQVYARPLGVVRVDVFEMTTGIPPDEILILRPHAYSVPLDKDRFLSDLFKYSLTHNIVEVNPDSAKIYLAKSKNGKTNITKDIMELLLNIMSPIHKDENQGSIEIKQV
jgi:hypothetical protein